MTAPPLPLSPGDQIRLHALPPSAFEFLTGQTLTVIDVTPNRLMVETSDGDDTQVMMDGDLQGTLTQYRVTPVHPWRCLARHFPDLLRLTPHPTGGEGRKVEVCEAPRLLAAGVSLAARAFLTAGWMRPDGEADFQPRFEGTVTVALQAGAESAGWDWALLTLRDAPRLRPGWVGATVGVQHPDGDVIRHGIAQTGALALARAMRLVSEAVWPGEREEVGA